MILDYCWSLVIGLTDFSNIHVQPQFNIYLKKSKSNITTDQQEKEDMMKW